MSTQTIEKSTHAVEKSRDLRAALAGSTKTVNIHIAQDDLEFLKINNYKMCFAKKVDNFAYNVVWQAYDRYLSNNIFSWTPQYQLFGTNLFQADVTVRVGTNTVTMGLGEKAVLNISGILQPPSTSDNPLAITMENEYGYIHPGVNQVATTLDGKITSAPIYVAENAINKGTASLMPVEKVQVWFEQNIDTATMFSTVRSRQIEVDLTTENSINIEYKGQVWLRIS